MQGALRGDGTIFESIGGAGGEVNDDTGMLIRTGITEDLVSSSVTTVLDGLTGFDDLDQFYLAFSSEDGDTGIFRVADTVSGDGWTPNNIELILLLDSFDATNLINAMFVDFSLIQ
jgi:hypothetical protein